MIAPVATTRLLSAFTDTDKVGIADSVEPLIELEEVVLLAIAKGLSDAEIADSIFISTATVKNHVVPLKAKIGARNRVEAAFWAMKLPGFRTPGRLRALCCRKTLPPPSFHPLGEGGMGSRKKRSHLSMRPFSNCLVKQGLFRSPCLHQEVRLPALLALARPFR
ncbi:MAG: hypothetical protein CL726_01570 [Chloroflexi bacterium]|jgi:DNA-binding CsgD family transcriptional regulator|nr:hypothetical protein [Chloroflexota bacterium]